jgi:hypothetical protein
MKKLKPWLVIVLVFCAGFVGGIVVTRGVIRHFVREAINDPNFMRDKIERRLAARLRLDPAQRAKVHAVLVDTQRDLGSLREEFRPRFFSIMNQGQARISQILTSEQRQKFEEFQNENRQLWQPK